MSGGLEAKNEKKKEKKKSAKKKPKFHRAAYEEKKYQAKDVGGKGTGNRKYHTQKTADPAQYKRRKSKGGGEFTYGLSDQAEKMGASGTAHPNRKRGNIHAAKHVHYLRGKGGKEKKGETSATLRQGPQVEWLGPPNHDGVKAPGLKKGDKSSRQPIAQKAPNTIGFNEKPGKKLLGAVLAKRGGWG